MCSKKHDSNGKDVPPRAVLFDFDNLAIPGHQIAYEALKDVLGAKDINVPPPFYSRFCLDRPCERCVAGILEFTGKTALHGDKLADQVRQKIENKLSKKDQVRLDGELEQVLKQAMGEGMRAGALSFMRPQTAESLARRLGLMDMGVELLCVPRQDKPWATADDWRKLAKKVSVMPALCAVIAAGGTACRAALEASIRCLARPDKFTEFQDFAGADFVVEKLDSKSADQLFRLLDVS